MALPALLKTSGITMVTTGVVTLAGFLTSVITARMLGPEGRGLLSAAVIIATLSGSLALCGLPNSFVYHKGAGRHFHYKVLLVVSLLLIGALAVVFALAGVKLSNAAGLKSEIGLILSLAAATAIQSYFYTVSQLHHGLRFFNGMRIGLVAGNLLAVLVLLLFFTSFAYEQVLLAQALVMSVLAVAGVVWAKRYGIWQNRAQGSGAARWRDIWRYGASHHGTVVLGILLVNFDKVALLRIGSMAEFGIYALAFTTSRFIGAVQEAASIALYARFAGKDTVELRQSVNRAFRVTFLPMLVVAAIGALASPYLLVWIYGPAFKSMAVPFSILLFECVIGHASWTLAQRFNASGRPGLVFLRQFISVLPIFLLLPFIPRENTPVYLSWLMLAGAVLRLVVTISLYPLSLKERMPRVLPEREDVGAIFRRFAAR